MSKQILLVISGSFKRFIEIHNLDEDIEVHKINDKLLAKPKLIFNLIEKSRIKEVYFATIDNSFQRFQFFMSLYSVLKSKKAFLIDENRNRLFLSKSKLLLIELPKFLLEINVTGLAVIFYTLIYRFYKWKFLKS